MQSVIIIASELFLTVTILIRIQILTQQRLPVVITVIAIRPAI